jgi:PAS domain S-box-containing protein
MASAGSLSRENNFNLLRFLAATAVIISHSFYLSGMAELRPVHFFIGPWDAADIGVTVFFVISGYLVTQSFMQRRDLWVFLEARFLRIFPALFVVLFFTVLVIGPLATSLPLSVYFSDWDTYRYFFQNLALVKIEQTLPGVFIGAPESGHVNNSLWTLPWEIRCYLGLALLGTIFVLPRPKAFKLAFMLGLVLVFCWPLLSWLDGIESFAPLRLGVFFVLGAFFYLARIPLRPMGVVALALAAFILFFVAPTRLTWVVPGILLAYTALWFALDPRVCIRSFNRFGDYSYGLYIYAFPIQQSLVSFSGGMGAGELFFLSFALTLPLAVLSWHFLERRALALKGKLHFGSLLPSRWDHVPVGIEQVDLRGPLLHVNRKLCEMLGYTREELERLSFRDITHPVDLRNEEKFLSRLISGKIRSYSIEKRYLHKDGHTVPVRVTSSQVSGRASGGGYRISIIEDCSGAAAADAAAISLECSRASRFGALKQVLPDRLHELNETIHSAIAECLAYRERALSHGRSLKLRTRT